jgi:hypothetical protein
MFLPTLERFLERFFRNGEQLIHQIFLDPVNCVETASFQGRLQLRKQKKSLLEPNLESRVAGVQRSLRFSPKNCAQGMTSELVHCRGATPNSGSSTTEASSGVA